ncbi:MAG: methionine--tRNA ligase [Candidatus Diapherotrites archaeon]|nr:methionine--tRNA ligase [Candidatus Diapherotrites archaeon]
METKPIVEFSDFEKLDIRIGAVLSAERIPNSDKLLKLEVDFGLEKRQILTGMAEFYSPEHFVNKQFPFLLNIPVRKIRGLESQGMLLSPDVNGVPTLFALEKPVPNGSSLM